MSAKAIRRGRVRIRVTRGEDDVGYAKPPRANRFKPGHSGNPKGRPKGAKNEATILTQLLNRKIKVRQGDKMRTITILEGIFHKLAEDSLKGNTKSAAFVLNRLAAIATSGNAESEIGPDDKAVLEAYLQKFKARPDGEEGSHE